MFRQLFNFMDQFLSKYQYGLRKGHNTQYYLLAMQKWKAALDKGK